MKPETFIDFYCIHQDEETRTSLQEVINEAISEHEAVIKSLATALNEITKGKGRYSMDRLTHASNTIEDMIVIAKEALNELPAPYKEGGEG